MSAASFDVTGKVVVITGATKGLGRAMAFGFAEAGADVVVASRDLSACQAVAEDLRGLGSHALAVKCHVGDWDQCEALIAATVDEFGRIDVLINNAGIAPVARSLKDVTSTLFDKTIEVNLRGPLRLTALAAEHMGRGSAIINISSKAALHPTPLTVVYAAAKAGQNAMTIAAAQELGPRGIRVNGIVCGTFETESFRNALPDVSWQDTVLSRIALGRIAGADEIVGTAIFLTSDAAAYVNGALITVDGG